VPPPLAPPIPPSAVATGGYLRAPSEVAPGAAGARPPRGRADAARCGGGGGRLPGEDHRQCGARDPLRCLCSLIVFLFWRRLR